MAAIGPVRLGTQRGSERFGVLVIKRDLTTAWRTVAVMAALQGALSGGVLMLFACCLAVLGNRIVTPRIERLLAAAKRFSLGDLGARAELGGSDELAQLGDGFNRMAAQIASEMAERRSSDERVRALAYQDSLTGLPNRTLFLDRLEQALAQAQRGSYHLALLFLDLDRFKTINDTLGHMAGDELLRQAGLRLRESLRDGDTVARLGGDEFVVLLPRVVTARHAGAVAEKVLATLGAPFVVSGHDLYLTGSLGVSLYPRDGSDPETKHADTALYRAKEEQPCSLSSDFRVPG